MINSKNLHKNERGIVAIIVSIIIMIILSLIVISFSRIMRREQEQALDRQLSTQAFYAAEAGVNDARKAFYDGTLTDKETCQAADGSPLSKNVIDADNIVLYTCVIIDSTPASLVYDTISVDRSTVVEIRAVNDTTGDPQEIHTITVAWEDSGGSANFRPGSSIELPPSQDWSAPGILRMEIIPLPHAGYSRETLRRDSRVFYLYPNVAGGGIPVPWGDGTNNGAIIGGNCSTIATDRARDCQVEIGGGTSLPLTAGDSYLVRMSSVYRPVSVTLSAQTSSGEASFQDAQASVDSTGKANDVLRRIQERLPLTFSFDFPEFALDIGDDLCKRLEAEPASVTVDSSSIGVASCTP